MNIPRIIYTRHARRRILERGLDVDHIERIALEPVAIVESYPEDTPFPSRLVLGWHDGAPLHILVAEDSSRGTIVIVTAYHPDPERWDDTFLVRRSTS